MILFIQKKVILYIYNFIIFVLCKIKHLYNFKDSSYFQWIQKKQGKKKKRKNENRKRAQIRNWAYQHNRLEVESAVRGSVGHLVDSQSHTVSLQTKIQSIPQYHADVQSIIPEEQSWYQNRKQPKKMTELISSANFYLIVPLNNNENLYTTLYHIYPAVILKLYLQYF